MKTNLCITVLILISFLLPTNQSLADPPPGTVSGTVTNSQGSPLGGVTVRAIDPNLSNVIVNTTNTNDSGQYSLDLPEGTYKLLFSPPVDLGNYYGEYYDNTNNFGLAQRITVISGQTTPGIDAILGPIPRLNFFDLAVYNGSLSANFNVQPGARELLKSATLTWPNGHDYPFELTDTLNWLTECRYSVFWYKTFSDTPFDYGVYTLTLEYYGGVVENYTKKLDETYVARVDKESINVDVKENGDVQVSWTLPETNNGKYYQVRVRDETGRIDYYRSSMVKDQNTVYIPAKDLGCLEIGESYKWYVRAFGAFDVDPTLSNWGVTTYSRVEQSAKSFIYHPSGPVQRITSFVVKRWNGKLAIGFDVRPTSRGDIVVLDGKFQAYVTLPDNPAPDNPYYFNQQEDFVDLSTEMRIYKTWWKRFDDRDFMAGTYTLQVKFADRSDPEEKQITLADIGDVVEIDPTTMQYEPYDNGTANFSWDLPIGATNQYYDIRVKSEDEKREYFALQQRAKDSDRVEMGIAGGLRLNQCDRYRWSALVSDPSNTSIREIYAKPKSPEEGETPDLFVYNPFKVDCSNFPLNTPQGIDIEVVPNDPKSSTSPVKITFAGITQGGTTYLNILDTSPPLPEGFKLGEPPTYYDITTTASYITPVKVCINYSGVSFGDELNLELFHLEDGTWVDRTVSLNTTSKIICASATSLSPFVVLEKVDLTPPAVSITAIPNILWPPNGKMVNVKIGGGASDSQSGIASISFKVTDEYGKVEPAISHFGDVIQLEASRKGDDSSGRIYTISVTATDNAGNQATALTTVICPHDQGKK